MAVHGQTGNSNNQCSEMRIYYNTGSENSGKVMITGVEVIQNNRINIPNTLNGYCKIASLTLKCNTERIINEEIDIGLSGKQFKIDQSCKIQVIGLRGTVEDIKIENMEYWLMFEKMPSFEEEENENQSTIPQNSINDTKTLNKDNKTNPSFNKRSPLNNYETTINLTNKTITSTEKNININNATTIEIPRIIINSTSRIPIDITIAIEQNISNKPTTEIIMIKQINLTTQSINITTTGKTTNLPTTTLNHFKTTVDKRTTQY